MVRQNHSPLQPSLERLESLDSMEGLAKSAPSPAPRLFNRLPLGALVYAVYPGLLVVLTIALAAMSLSEHYGAPVMLFALLLGMAFHFLHESGRCVAGIEFASRAVLRTGVALLGARVTATQIVSLGVGPILLVVASVGTTIFVGWMVARRLGLSRNIGILSGGAVAICGASAALAIASVLPQNRNTTQDAILTVVAVTTLSTIAMILYPVLVATLHMDQTHAGLFLGGTIHDVAQVVGAGYMISPLAGDIATYVKLLRVAMLLPVVFIIAAFTARDVNASAARRPPRVPLFLLGFAALVAINSFDLISRPVAYTMTEASRWALVSAIAALGMKTSFKDLIGVGWAPVGLMLVETAWIAAFVLGAVVWLI